MFRNLFVVMDMIFFDLAWGGEEVIKVRFGYVTKVAERSPAAGAKPIISRVPA